MFLSQASTFPPRGKVKIGGEVIGYNGTNSYGLTLVKRGMEKSKIKIIKKELKLSSLRKLILQEKFVGNFVDTPVDLQKCNAALFPCYQNLIWYIVNQLKAFLMEQVTTILNAIGLASVSPIPLFVKGVTEIILQVLRMIGCSLDGALVDAIMGGIEGFIEAFIDEILNNLASLR